MLKLAQKELASLADAKKALTYRNFFKHCKNDTFLGVTAPLIRKTAKQFSALSLPDVLTLMKSNIHDERSLAHAILRNKYDNGSVAEQNKIFHFYLKNRHTIRDWDGVDDSAPYIVGKHLLNGDTMILYDLVASEHLWTRRIAIVSTWWFIRHNLLDDTFKLAKILLPDEEDLIHKATGWMLREAGKRDVNRLKKFLDTHGRNMPRTMLRYAIEKLDEPKRKRYLKITSA